MLKLLKNINYLYVGFFLMPLSLISFLFFDDTVRIAVLFLAFTCISIPVLKCPNKQGSFRFIFRSVILFIIFFLIASIKNQNTLDVLNLTFGFVCLLLIIFGYILSKNHFLFNKINQSTTLVLSFILIFFSFYFFLFVGQLDFRNFETEVVFNPVSSAYSFGIIFMFLFSIFYTQKSYSLLTKIILVISLFVAFLAILITQSKGTFLYIPLTIIFYFRINFLKKFILLSISFYVLFLTLIFFFSESSLFVINKLQLLYDRITDLVGFVNGSINVSDNSSLTRINYYLDFYNNIDSIIFSGQNNYTPYPHNIFLETIMRWGLFGLPIIYLYLNGFFRALNSKTFKNSTLHITISLIFIFCCFQSLSSLTLEMNRFMWLGFGFFISSRND
jgi:hypothetical protein